jgi:hypothetical protein
MGHCGSVSWAGIRSLKNWLMGSRSAFCINAHTWGLNSSYGVFLAHCRFLTESCLGFELM